MPVPFAIAVPVGPDPREIDRVRDLAASVSAYENAGDAWFVMVDDAPAPRDLVSLVGPSLNRGSTPVSLHHPRHDRATNFRAGKGIISAILLAVKWIEGQTAAQFALKLDTDSLVINPFRDKLAALFDSSPSLGIAGAYRQTPNGTKRNWMHAHLLNAMRRPAFSWRHPLRRSRWKADSAHAHIAELIDSALAHDYDVGEHCMGGGYAVSRELLTRMAEDGQLDEPSRWMGIDLPEDVTMGLHCRAAGLTMLDQVLPGEVFGVRYEGLPFSPEELAAKGYSVIHAVKNDPRFDEQAIRAFFAERRAAPSA